MNVSLTGFPAYMAIIVTVTLLFSLPIYLISKIRRKSYEISREFGSIIKVEYEAPLGLTPAELGYLTDAKFSKQELYATLLDLEQRGFISIEKNFPNSFNIHDLRKDSSSLFDHEKYVLKEFKHTNSASIFTHTKLSNFRSEVVISLFKKGLIKNSDKGVSYLARRVIIMTILINITLLTLFLLGAESSTGDKVFLVIMSPLFFTPITLPVSIILGYSYNKIVGDTGLWTKKMKKAWAEVAGYKEFIKQVELDNIQFESEDLKTKTKIKALPYAIALGFDTKWEKRFK
jgi:hypothetical protein